jgi:hypothetical protein
MIMVKETPQRRKGVDYGRDKWDNNSNESMRKHHATTAKDQEHKYK